MLSIDEPGQAINKKYHSYRPFRMDVLPTPLEISRSSIFGISTSLKRLRDAKQDRVQVLLVSSSKERQRPDIRLSDPESKPNTLVTLFFL